MLRFKKNNATDFPNLEETTLGEVCNKIGDGLHSAPTYDVDGEYYFINGNNLKDGTIIITSDTKKVSKETFLKNDKGLDSHTILLSINGTIGNLAYYKNENVMLGKSAAYLKIKKSVDKEYIYQLLQTRKVKTSFLLSLTGTTIKNLGLEAINKTHIFIPVLEEQHKIADFLSSVDEIIRVQEEEISALEEQKKGVMQKLFNREVRFKADDGSEYPEWEEKELGEIAKRVTRKNKNNETNLPLTISSIDGLVDQSTYFNKIIASRDMSGYYLLKKGEFAYNKSYSAGYDYGSIKRLDRYDMGALSTLYICFSLKDDVNSDYMVRYFDSLIWNREIGMFCAEGARNHGLLNIAVEDFFKIKILIPMSYKEQQKIVDCLSSYDEAIQIKKDKLGGWKEIKKGLLQQMFV